MGKKRRDDDEELFIFKIDDVLKKIAKRGRKEASENLRAVVELVKGGKEPKKLTERDVVQGLRQAYDEGLLTERQKERCMNSYEEWEENEEDRRQSGQGPMGPLPLILQILEDLAEQDD